jgi:hypothetical protein
MKEFLLLFRNAESDERKFSPEQMQAHMKHWQDWIGSIAQKNIMVGAQPLVKGGRVLSGPSKKITDGAFMEGKEVLGGYVLIKVANIEEATGIAEDCPILVHGSGTVEIREIGTMSPM